MAQDNYLKRSIIGCLLGTAVGDAIGLPFEGFTEASTSNGLQY